MPASPILSPLHECHEAAGAKFAEFGGWSMPLEYGPVAGTDERGGVLAEHEAVRTAAGLFDVSHLGKVLVTGPGAVDALNACLTNDLDRIGAGQAQYTLLCTPGGGVVDDLIAYRRSDEEVFLVPNAANTAAVVEVLAHHVPGAVTVSEQHHAWAVLALQGPTSDAVLTVLGLPSDLDYMSFVDTSLVVGGRKVAVTLCRTGYTGERGVELVVPADDAVEVWNALVAAGAGHGLRPAGLGARDTLRTEMGYALHGHEITRDITPVQARLGWAVGWDKPTFLGSDVLRAEKEAGPRRWARALRAVGRGIPRAGMSVVDQETGTEIGVVTSGTFSPTLRTGIALALVERSVPLAARVGVRVRSRVEEFDVVKPPFVPARTAG